MHPQSCRTSLLLLISFILWAAGATGSLARNLLKRKWSRMSGWRLKGEKSLFSSFSWIFLFLLLIFLPFVCVIIISASLSVISSSLRGFHLDLQTPPPGATLITYRGNGKCGPKSKLKWVFHHGLLIFWRRYVVSYSQEYFSSNLCSASFWLMKRNDAVSTSKPHFLHLRTVPLSRGKLPVRLDWAVQKNVNSEFYPSFTPLSSM